MIEFTIDEIDIPDTIDAANAVDFIAAIDVRNAVEAAGYGSNEMDYAAAEILPGYQSQEFEPKRLFVARVDGGVVARAVSETRPGEDSDACWVSVQVRPEYRGRGIGTALAETVEALAREENCKKAIVYAVSPAAEGERLESPTGFGSVPLANREVLFMLARGYSLEQVERASRLALPVEEGMLQYAFAEASERAGADYAVHCWIGNTPRLWIEDIAMLLTRMSTDAPTAGLEEPEDPWSVERVLEYEERHASSPRTEIFAAVGHVPSGHLVGFTGLSVPAELSRPVQQEDTIVIKEHRGHRLGMLLKIANIRHLQDTRPGHPSIVTFNAEENRHMLSVNEAVGFVPIAYEGAWKKLL